MQISLIHYSAPPVVGGVESVLAHQARLLADDGHAVRVIAGRGAQTDERVRFIALPLADSQHPRLAALKKELDAGRVPAEFGETVTQIETDLRAALSKSEVVIAHNVCSLNKNLALTAALRNLSQQSGAPRFILWHHDLAWTTPRYQPELHAGYPWELLRTDWPGVTQVVISELRRRELCALMNIPTETVRVIPNGIALAHFYKLEPQTQTLLARLRLVEAAPILLLPVRITPRKNIELALRALAALTPRPPLPKGGGERRPALVVTGPLGPHNANNRAYFESLKTLRAELQLEGAAHFLAELSDDYLPDAVIADFYRFADALFLPSREEGFGLPVLEAALSRMPVFCADLPPLRALAGEAAMYFSPDADPAQLAAAVAARLQADDAFQLSARVRGAFTWEAVYRHHLAPLLAEHAPRGSTP
jgi:glycosyltransferase involved in cell wall biosynthesis